MVAFVVQTIDGHGHHPRMDAIRLHPITLGSLAHFWDNWHAVAVGKQLRIADRPVSAAAPRWVRCPAAGRRCDLSRCRGPAGRLVSGLVVHAPRQTGKTTSPGALARDLTAEGRHVALLFSCEAAKVTGDDYGAAGRAILGRIAAEAGRMRLAPELMPRSPWPDTPPEEVLAAGPEAWALACPSAGAVLPRGGRAARPVAVQRAGGAADLRPPPER